MSEWFQWSRQGWVRANSTVEEPKKETGLKNKPKKKCIGCGEMFTAKATWAKYCSKYCGNKNRKSKKGS